MTYPLRAPVVGVATALLGRWKPGKGRRMCT